MTQLKWLTISLLIMGLVSFTMSGYAQHQTPPTVPQTLPAIAEPPDAEYEAFEQSIVVHLSHFTDDLHAALMAIQIANILQKNGAQVTLWVNLEGVRAVDKRQPNRLSWGMGHGDSFADRYEAFIKAGGRVLVCPHCAAAAGITESDLRPGAQLGTEADIAAMFLEADKVIDY